MPQKYTTKSGKVLTFPDDATIEEIQSVADAEDGVVKATKPSKPFGLGDMISTAMRTTPIPGIPENVVGRGAWNQMADVVQDPVGSIPTAGAQVGATVGTAFGTPGRAAGAAIGGGAGKAIQNLIRARPVTEGIGSEAAMQAATETLPPVVGKAAKGAGKWLYGKALRPAASDLAKMVENSRMLPDQMRSYLTDVGIKNKIPVTAAGIHKVEGIKDQLENSIQAKLNASPAQIDMNAVKSNATQAFSRNFGTQNIPQDDAAVFQTAMQKFDQNPLTRKPVMQRTPESERFFDAAAPKFQQAGTAPANRLPVAKVNAMRVGSNKATKDRWGELGKAGVEAQKSISRAEAQAVKAAVPETAPMFQDWHDLINLQKALTRTTTNASNAKPITLYELLGVLKGDPAVIGLGTFSRPGVLGAIGQSTYNAGVRSAKTPAEAIRLMTLAMMTGETDDR